MTVVNMTQMKQLARAVLTSPFPLLIRGKHAIGKSEFVYQFAKEAGTLVGQDAELRVIEKRASLMDVGDLQGLPYKGPEIGGQSSTQFNPPDWYLRACVEPVILFFDEVDRACMEVRQGIFQINDSRQLDGHHLHPGTRVVACINGGQHGAMYQVGDFDPAELDRYTVYDLEPTVEEWIDYATLTDHLPEVISFVRENPQWLEVTDVSGFDPTQVTPSRRSWTRLSTTLKALDMFADGFEDAHGPMMFNIAQGFVGEDASVAFKNHALDYIRAVRPEDVIYEGNIEALNDIQISTMMEFVNEFIASGIMNRNDLTEEYVSNIRQAIQMFPTEALIVFFKNLVTSGDFLPENIEKLGWDYDNKETEEEQIEFTKFIKDKLIEPEEDEELKKLIEQAQKADEEESSDEE